MLKKSVYACFLFSLCVLLTSCTLGYQENQIHQESVIYGSGRNAEQNLTVADPVTLKPIKTIKVTNGWTNRIYMDSSRRIWIPIVNKPDMTHQDDRVFILNNNGKIDHVTVGYAPHYIFFNGKMVYVVCDEDGKNPSIYQIDQYLQVKKMITVTNGGLISNAVFDGKNLYFSSYRDLGNYNFYPFLVKVSLSGQVHTEKLSKVKCGLNNLLLFEHTLILGLEAPKKDDSTLVMYDAGTLQKIKNLQYKESMVGDILSIDNGDIAVTNYSRLGFKGQKVTVLNVKENKVIKTFHTTYPVEALSYVNHQFIAVDNDHDKLEVFDENGKSKGIRNIPTQVFNMILRPAK
jgi:DNA-binding beta-propeller fold protein YncE